MENVRKNSMAPPIAVGAAAAAGGYGAPQIQSGAPPRLPTVGESQSPYPSPQPQPHAASASPRPRPPQATSGPQARPFQNATRYSLADPGSSPSASPRPGAGAGGSAPHRQPSGQQQPPPSGFDNAGGAPPPVQKPGKGPQTFAEMGIASTTAQKDDCVIM